LVAASYLYTESKLNWMSKKFAYFGIVMGGIFVCGGILLVFRHDLVNLPPEFRPYHNLLGAIVIMYGLFRIYRSYLVIKEHREKI